MLRPNYSESFNDSGDRNANLAPMTMALQAAFGCYINLVNWMPAISQSIFRVTSLPYKVKH